VHLPCQQEPESDCMKLSTPERLVHDAFQGHKRTHLLPLVPRTYKVFEPALLICIAASGLVATPNPYCKQPRPNVGNTWIRIKCMPQQAFL
jgi:hypothetical protein